MTLSKDDLRIGNTVYLMKTINNLLTQDKIFMTDSEGNQWTRYDKPLWSFKVVPMVICGTIQQIVTGKVDEDLTDDMQYHMEMDDGEITYFYENQLTDPQYGYDSVDSVYASAGEAEAAGETFCANRNTQC